MKKLAKKGHTNGGGTNQNMGIQWRMDFNER
jgi:hypothetical protein